MKKQVGLPSIVFCLLCLLLSIFVKAQGLTPFKAANGKYGYKYRAGGIVVPPKYQEARAFGYDELAAVKSDNKWGFVNKEGAEVVKPKYDRLGKEKDIMFLGGYLQVQLNGKWGLIDEQGKEIVAAQYQDVHPSDNQKGFFPIKLDNKWGYVNRAGQVIIPPKYEDAYYFENDIALVQLHEKWGAVDVSGKEVIPFQYDDLEYAYELGKPLNWLLAQSKGKWGYIDTHGVVTISLLYQRIKEYLINYSDDPADTSELLAEGHFLNDVDMVKRNGKWGAVDTKGHEVIAVKYEDILNESGHDAFVKGARWFRVKLNGKWGLVDAAGNELLATRFANALFQYDIEEMKKISASKNKMVSSSSRVVATQAATNDVQGGTGTSKTSGVANQNRQVSMQALPGMKGIVDPDLVGTWKYYDEPMHFNGYYIFRADGTFDYWSDMITPTAPPPGEDNFWRLNGDDLELKQKDYQKIFHKKILKRNDPQRNQPALLIEWDQPGSFRAYYPKESKPLWNKSLPQETSVSNAPQTNAKILEPPVRLNGTVDVSLLGLWKCTLGKIDYFLDLKPDGTYDTWSSSSPKKIKCFWRINNAFMETYHEGTGVKNYSFKKLNDLAKGKPTFLLEWATYYPETEKEMWK